MLSIFKIYRSFIIDEKDVTTVLGVINRNHKIVSELSVGNCGWGDGLEKKWFIHFYATDKTYGNIVKGLKDIGTLTLDVRPKGQVDICFERAH